MNIFKKNKNIKVLLINPPLASFDYMYAAVPLLLGQLKYSNINASAVDLNIEFLKEITSPSYISKTCKYLEKIYKNNKILNKNINNKYKLNNEQLKELNIKIEKCLFKHKKLIKFLTKSKTCFYEKYIHCSLNNESGFEKRYEKIFYYVLFLSFLPFYPEEIYSLGYDVWTKNKLYKLNYEDIIDKCSNRKRNIYINFFRKKIKDLNLKKYDVIGITIPFEQNIFPSLTLSKLLKQKTKAKIVIGGIQPTVLAESFSNHPDMFGVFFDAILNGEGEDSIKEYIKYVENKISISEVQNLIYNVDGNIIKNDIVKIKNINDVQAPSYENIDFNNYKFKLIPIEFSKGCYWHKCIFCYNHKLKRYYTKNYINAVDIIQNLQEKYKINFFCILDDALNIDFAEKFADEIIRRRLNIEYYCFLRTEETLTYEVLKKLKISGLKTIFIGVESGSEHVLSLMDKGINLETVQRVLKDCYKLEIRVIAGFIFGFPGETEEDIFKTIEFIKANEKYMQISCFKLAARKSSYIPELQEQLKITNIAQDEEFSDYITFKTNGISETRLNEILEENGINISTEKIK